MVWKVFMLTSSFVLPFLAVLFSLTGLAQRIRNSISPGAFENLANFGLQLPLFIFVGLGISNFGQEMCWAMFTHLPYCEIRCMKDWLTLEMTFFILRMLHIAVQWRFSLPFFIALNISMDSIYLSMPRAVAERIPLAVRIGIIVTKWILSFLMFKTIERRTRRNYLTWKERREVSCRQDLSPPTTPRKSEPERVNLRRALSEPVQTGFEIDDPLSITFTPCKKTD